jgi:hypothetical protein
MRAGIVVNVTRVDRRQLEAIISDRRAPQKHVWRAAIILATPLHPDLGILAQRGRRVLCKAHAPAPQARRIQSVVDLQLTINRFVADTNADPKPFVWTADPKRVPAAIKRGKQT